MNDHYKFSDLQHLYGYCACLTVLATEQITAGHNHHYHLIVIHPDACEPPMDNCVLLTTYEFSMDGLVSFIRDTDSKFISIERLTNNN